MTIEDIKILMETMARTKLTCLDWESSGNRLHLERHLSNPAINSEDYSTQEELAASETILSEISTKNSGKANVMIDKNLSSDSSSTTGYQDDNFSVDPNLLETEAKPGDLIKSPVVGIYYSSPSPDSDPFISVGSKIEIGMTLCIIEAMKLMNEVTSSFDGEIVEIMVENGQRVEFGQPLFRII